ncbi:hypothetical protein Taro_005966 [Colocasia esculenta]|uniref:Uncharacterized protein n=1 Tax=Colocasia esculenta TaxID=4460 RepID=A0A843TW58_COLES|nr:hypothetical protein [Colocasia esculenta]
MRYEMAVEAIKCRHGEMHLCKL